MTPPLPAPREQCGLLLLQLRRSVLPATFYAALLEVIRHQPLRGDSIRPLQDKLGVMQDDQELRFFLLERATVEEASLVVRSLEFLAAVSRGSSDESVSSLWSALLEHPIALVHILRSLECMARQMGE